MFTFSCFVLLTVLYLQALFEGVPTADLPCAERKTADGYVCVCNATYCDTIKRPSPMAAGGYIVYSTSNSTPGFSSSTGQFIVHTDPKYISNMRILVNSSVTLQTMKGIGGAFTDSFCINLKNLSSAAQENLLKSYFSTSGLEYTLARVPIAGSDCSPTIYTYDDYSYNVDLSDFNLTSYDYDFRIPVIKKAMELSSRGVSLLASAWSGPVWMKENNANIPGYLLPKYYQLWADYMIKFLDEYKKNGITFWAITTGNEPASPLFHPTYIISNMIALPQMHRMWYKKNLYPSLKKSQHRDIKIITFDDLRPFATWWLDRVTSEKDVVDMIDGIGLHGYTDVNESPEMLDILHEKYKHMFIINTEFCFLRKWDGGPIQRPGSWSRGAYYAYTIMDNLNHWSVGYLDWNMALNPEGGPMNIADGLEAPIVVVAERDEFLKNPIFYVMGHFSKFISNGSVKIQTLTEAVDSNSANLIEHLAMKNPDGSVSVHILNHADVNIPLTIRDTTRGEAHFTADANSMNTLVYW